MKKNSKFYNKSILNKKTNKIIQKKTLIKNHNNQKK